MFLMMRGNMNEETLYSISIEREALRCNKKAVKSTLEFSNIFGNKNNFIKAEKKRSTFKIKTPICSDAMEAYNKLEEITNVALLELYNREELIWPCSQFNCNNKRLKSNVKLNIMINKEYYTKKMIKTPEEINKKIEEGFNRKSYLLKKLYGEYKVKITKNSIQISNIPVNFLDKCGIGENDIVFLVALIFSCLESESNTDIDQEIKMLKKISNDYNLKAKKAIEKIYEELKNTNGRLKKEDELSIERKISLAEKYMKNACDSRYCLQKYKKLVSESVVLIKDAILQGIDYKILNEAKSVVEFRHNGHKEYVIEGNKTNRDSYIFPIITDDKMIAKQIMSEHGICVPNAVLLEKDTYKDEIDYLLRDFYNKPLVIKPRNTNYGIGITVFNKIATKKQILNAIEYAFKFDINILVEEYIKGMEYRFLVVDGKCLSVVNRRCASIVGNGVSNIKELIEEKNKEPWHFLTATPVKMDEPVVEYLKLQGYNYETIIPKDKRVFLRANANCSTGGESIVMTEIIPAKFKKISEKVAKIFNAKICGVDIIIDDLKEDNYSIIEINDSPGYSINEWPYEGKGEKIGIAILKLLNLI